MRFRYLLVAVAVMLLAVLQVEAQEGEKASSRLSHVTIVLPADNSTTDETSANANATANAGRVTLDINVTGSRILDHPDINNCLDYADGQIAGYPQGAAVSRTRRPGADLFYSYSTATVEIAGWMKGLEYPREATWGNVAQVLKGIRKYYDEGEGGLEPIAAAGLLDDKVFVYIVMAATSRQATIATN